MEKQILYIDMDGTIADFWGKIQEHIPHIDSLPYSEQESLVNELCMKEHHIFHTLCPIFGAKEAIGVLKEYYDIYFLSTPMKIAPESYADKRRWMRDHYDTWADERLILTHRKDLNIGKYLIDDRCVNGVENFKGEWIQYGSKKFPNWNTICKYLLKNVL